MCGIAGFAGWQRTHSGADRELRAMCEAIRHRGPDQDGRLVLPGVALGMRRLSIIDVAGGRQPIANEDGSVHVVFNGEIYNHRELQRSLELRGHRFATHSDTETLVHLFEDVGDDLVHHLRGMFAFAIWDERRERLLLARDRVGIKPLYYWEHAGGVAFGSELRTLLALPDFPRTIDRRAMAQYLSLGYVPDPECIFEGVRKLPPGHLLAWDRERGVEVKQYWSPVRPEIRISEQDAAVELRRLLGDAVGSHLESEVPLGAFLSGGLDSSTVVAEMARQLDRPVRTFSIGFTEEEFNEAPFAAAAAKEIGTEHTELIVRADADALIDDVVTSFDEPFADSSALPTYLVAHLARQQVTVALSGDGGDELFGGYTRYAQLLGQRELSPAVLRSALRAVALRLPMMAPGRNRLLDLARTRRGRYASTVAAALAPSEGGVVRPEIASLVGPLDALLDRWFTAASSRDFPTQMTMVDVLTYLPGDILTKVDRMSMAVSLEARVPLLDHHLVEFALSLPSALKMRDGTGKWIFRKVIADIVPAAVLQRPKRGFALPLRRWLRSELRHRVDALLRPDSPIYEYVEPDAVASLALEHRIGRRDHSPLLWRLLVLDLWLRALAANALALPLAGAAGVRGVRDGRATRAEQPSETAAC